MGGGIQQNTQDPENPGGTLREMKAFKSSHVYTGAGKMQVQAEKTREDVQPPPQAGPKAQNKPRSLVKALPSAKLVFPMQTLGEVAVSSDAQPSLDPTVNSLNSCFQPPQLSSVGLGVSYFADFKSKCCLTEKIT